MTNTLVGGAKDKATRSTAVPGATTRSVSRCGQATRSAAALATARWMVAPASTRSAVAPATRSTTGSPVRPQRQARLDGAGKRPADSVARATTRWDGGVNNDTLDGGEENDDSLVGWHRRGPPPRRPLGQRHPRGRATATIRCFGDFGNTRAACGDSSTGWSANRTTTRSRACAGNDAMGGHDVLPTVPCAAADGYDFEM